jgi:hypothetical protein
MRRIEVGEVGRSSESRPLARWAVGLTSLVAATSATLTITLPAAHRAPLGVVLLTISAACWLTVLLAAHRLHHALTPSPPRAPARLRSVQPFPRPAPPLDDQPSAILHAAVILARHGRSPQHIAESLHLPLAFAELLAHHAGDSHDGHVSWPPPVNDR